MIVSNPILVFFLISASEAGPLRGNFGQHHHHGNAGAISGRPGFHDPKFLSSAVESTPLTLTSAQGATNTPSPPAISTYYTPLSPPPVSVSFTHFSATGTANTNIPTALTALPTGNAVSSADYAKNIERAKQLNSLFANLTDNSACTRNQAACIKGNVGRCRADGSYDIIFCAQGTSCFALPMINGIGAELECVGAAEASVILGATPPATATPTAKPTGGESGTCTELPGSYSTTTTVAQGSSETTVTVTLTATATSTPAQPATSSPSSGSVPSQTSAIPTTPLPTSLFSSLVLSPTTRPSTTPSTTLLPPPPPTTATSSSPPPPPPPPPTSNTQTSQPPLSTSEGFKSFASNKVIPTVLPTTNPAYVAHTVTLTMGTTATRTFTIPAADF